MSQDFWKFMVHDFLKINVPRFFGIHSPRFFGIQCPTIFCDFGLFNRLAQAGGGGPYYMIFHYQKHTVLNYFYAVVNQLPWHTNNSLDVISSLLGFFLCKVAMQTFLSKTYWVTYCKDFNVTFHLYCAKVSEGLQEGFPENNSFGMVHRSSQDQTRWFVKLSKRGREVGCTALAHDTGSI